ncbi:ankyrin [Ascobolus immersus RN42]|uniref:Ankyrin n=1 Tax=Ascobolus immersus RN42 TaxID=1160509 RepID=A0A3N4I6C2_ASCIM|nr:ankyrin [Ascobolus immersus RN42]
MASSTTWEDNILFAVGPLGIVTAIVSAIRIGGPLWLRAIIGRARESRAIAEEELTNSTSEDVCEIWNGTSVVRLVGSPRILQLAYLNDPSIKQPEDRLLTLENGTKTGYRFEAAAESAGKLSTIRFLANTKSTKDDEEARQSRKPRRKNTQAVAPNLFLNLRPKLSTGGRWEQRAFVVLGIILQAGVLVFTGPTVYHSSLKQMFRKEDEFLEPQAYPLTAIGTVLLVVGMWICSIVVESSTEEQNWEISAPTTSGSMHQHKTFRVIWLQQAGTVTDQQFDSYAIIAKESRTGIVTRRLVSSIREELPSSTGLPASSPKLKSITGKRQALHVDQSRNGHQYYCNSARIKTPDPSAILQTVTTIGTLISVVGFVLQFTGFRSMHYSAAIAQLIVTAIMVLVRAYLRRGLALTPTAYQIPESYEMEWLSIKLAFEPNKLWLPDPETASRLEGIKSYFAKTTVAAGTPTCSTASDQCTCQLSDGMLCNWDIVTGKSAGPFQFHDLPLSSFSGCHQAMKIRERIGQISKWIGSVSEAAVALSTAIEVVMNSLFDDSLVTDMAWTMQGCKSPTLLDDSGIVHLTVRRKRGFWKSSATEIDSFLSLWLFSIHSQGGEQLDDMDPGEQEDWLRKGSNAIRSPAIHLLGNDTSDSAYFRDLTWYMGDMLQEVRTLQPSIVSNSSSGQTVTVEPQLLLGFERLEGPVTPLPNVARTFSLLPLNYRKSYLEPFIRAHENGENASSRPAPSPISLGLFAEAPLEKHLVQDMFSSFIWAVSRKMERIRGLTVVVPKTTSVDQSTTDGDWRYFHLQNDQISKLINDLEAVAGDWLGGTDGILFSMIPQLSLSDKLPTPLGMIDYVREISLPFENVGNWRKVVEIHLFLFECCGNFRVGSEIRKKVVSVLVNLCSRIGELRLEREQFGVDGELINEAQEDEQKLVNALATLELGGDGLVRKLATLYRAQDRPLLSLEYQLQALGLDITACLKHFAGFEGATGLHQVCLEESIPHQWQVQASDLNAQDELGLTWLHYFLLVRRTSQQYDTGLWVMRRKLKEFFGESNNFDPKLVDISGWSVVHYAVSSETFTSHGSFLALLGLDRPVRNTIEYGFGQDLSGRTPFHLVRSDDVARKLTAVAGAALGILDRDESDALMVITRRGFSRAASLLLDVGGNSRSTDGSRRSVIHWAAYHGDNDLVSKLKKKGADLNGKDGMERTPFHWTRASKALLDCWTALEVRPEGLDSKDSSGRTVLHLGALAGTVSELSLERLLSGNQSLLQTADSFAFTPLSLAASKGRKTTVQCLLDAIRMSVRAAPGNHAAINGVDQEYENISMDLGEDCSMDLDDGLSMDLDLDVPEGQRNQDTSLAQPFGLAVQNGHDEIVRLLLNRGADMEPPEYGSTFQETDTGAVSNATKYDQQAIVKILFNRWPRSLANSDDCTEAVRIAITSGNEPLALLLLRRGCRFERNFAVQHRGSAYLLAEACHRGMYETVRLLLDLGLEIDAVESQATAGIWLPDPRDTTTLALDHSALYIAAAAGQGAIVQLLLDKGALVNLEGDDGRTALFAAVESGHEGVVRLLLSRGARMGAQRVGRTDPTIEPSESIKEIFKEFGASYQMEEARSVPANSQAVQGLSMMWQSGSFMSASYFRPLHGHWDVDGRWDGEIREIKGEEFYYIKRGCL